jgi:hypothetical protein
MDLSREASAGAMSGDSKSPQPMMALASGLAMPMTLSLGPTCGGAARGSIEGINGDAFKIPAVEGFPMAMQTPYQVHKAKVGGSTRQDGS